MRPTVRRRLVAAVAITVLALPATTSGATPHSTNRAAGPAPQQRAPPPRPIDWAAVGVQQVPKETPSPAVLSGAAKPAGVNPYTSWGQDPASINTYLTPASDRIAFIGQAVGNIVSQEAGHFLGSFHVDQFDASANLMDRGGNAPAIFGVGPDGVGGTADDLDVDFGDDVFVPDEGLTGIEETLVRTAFGLSRGRGFA